MRDYGIVSPRFWIGETGRKLRKMPDAQRVAMYLMTAPTAEMTGVFYCPIATILNDVGDPCEPLSHPREGASEGLARVGAPPSEGHQRAIEGVKKALKALQELNFCFYDFESEFVFVTEMAHWQIAEKLKPSDNRVKGIRKAVESFPEPMRARFLERYNEDFSLGFDEKTKAEKVSPLQAPSEPLRSQEQEQKQEQEQEHKEVAPAPATKPKAKREPVLLFPDALPAEWRQAALEVRTDVTPERVFLKLRGRFAPTTTKKTMGNWRKIFLDWIGREFPETGKPHAAKALPPHKDPAFHFDDNYYADAIKPDGTTDWGI